MSLSLLDTPPKKRIRNYQKSPEQMERNRIKTAEYRKLNYERVRARERASQERLTLEQRKQRSLRYNLWHQYGMTISDYMALVELQQGACAICHSLPPEGKRLHIDHCHTTGKVRGLLCQRCNQGMIAVDHYEGFCEKAIAYKRRA